MLERLQNTIGLDTAGLTLGFGTRLVRFDPGSGRLGVDSDCERCLALIAVATRAPIDPAAIGHFEAAATSWERGDKALANLRLVFAGLPRLRCAGDAARLAAAEYLLDHGMTPRCCSRRWNGGQSSDHRHFGGWSHTDSAGSGCRSAHKGS